MLIYAHQVGQTNIILNRTYLEEFFPRKKCLIITELSINAHYTCQHLVEEINQIDNLDQIIIDLTHNPWPWTDIIKEKNISALLKCGLHYLPTVCLINDFKFYSTAREHFIFFPIYLWMYSARRPLWYRSNYIEFDGESNKTQEICSLNRNPHGHRIILFNLLVKRSYMNRIAFTFGNFMPWAPYNKHEINLLTPEDRAEFESNQYLLPMIAIDNNIQTDTQAVEWDMGIRHPVYKTCAFNLITETVTDQKYFHSEKTCKSFMAQQIPIIIGPAGINHFLEEVGLDMFADVVPWKTWDMILDERQRITKIVEFLDELMKQDLLAIYQANLTRVESNKEYFHSEEFRKILLQQMPKP